MLSETAPVFVEMAHQIVWASVATVSGNGRPRSRILHPIWQWDGEQLVGWIATGPTPIKRAHLENSPYVSVNYWAPTHDTCVAECRASWAFDDETRKMVWDLFLNGPEPVGYDPKIIPEMIAAIRDGRGDFVFGSRFLPPENALVGGMPRYKYLANRFLTAVENFVMGTNLAECHTGYRAYSRRLLETVPFLRNSNDFAFDTEMIFQANYFGFKFAEVPVTTKYFNEASSISFAASTIYGLKTLWVAGRYLLHRLKIWRFDLFQPAHRGKAVVSGR